MLVAGRTKRLIFVVMLNEPLALSTVEGGAERSRSIWFRMESAYRPQPDVSTELDMTSRVRWFAPCCSGELFVQMGEKSW